VTQVEERGPVTVRPALTRWIKVTYGVGAGGWVIVDRVMLTWLYAFYVATPLAGVDALLLPVTFGVVMLIGRVVDSLADPLVARLSDNHRGRFGRRIPFLAASALPFVAVTIALFYPPVMERSGWNGVYLAVMLGLYFILFTAYVGPHLALLADISASIKDRVDLSTSKAVGYLFGAAVALIVSPLLAEAYGVRGMVWLLGGIAVVLMYVPVVVPERRLSTAEPATMPLLLAVRTTLRNRPFLIAIVGTNAFWFGFNIVTINIVLYATRLMGLSEGAVALLMGAVFGTCLLVFPAANVLAKRRGLKWVMVASLVLFAIAFPLLYFLGDPPFGLPVMAFGVGVMAIAGIALAGFFIVPDAIIAATADLELTISGQRREGMYYGVNGLLQKVNLGVSTLVSGALLQFGGDPFGLQLTGPVAAVAVLLGLLVFLRYPEREVEAARTAALAAEAAVGAPRPGAASTLASEGDAGQPGSRPTSDPSDA
jgi:glycoside/pentoside/hexuronide:cation symporter, GPH family